MNKSDGVSGNNKSFENNFITNKQSTKKSNSKDPFFDGSPGIKEKTEKISKENLSGTSLSNSQKEIQIHPKNNENKNLNFKKLFSNEEIHKNLKQYQEKVNELKTEKKEFFENCINNESSDHGTYNLLKKAEQLKEMIQKLSHTENSEIFNNNLEGLLDVCDEVIIPCQKILDKIKQSNPRENKIANVDKPLRQLTSIADCLVSSFDGKKEIQSLAQDSSEELKPNVISNEVEDDLKEIIVPNRLWKDIDRLTFEVNGKLISTGSDPKHAKFVVAQKMQEALGENLLWKLGPIINQGVTAKFLTPIFNGKKIEEKLVERPLGLGDPVKIDSTALSNVIGSRTDLSSESLKVIEKHLDQVCSFKISIQEEKDGSLFVSVSVFKRFTYQSEELHYNPKDTEIDNKLENIFCKLSFDIKISKEEVNRIKNIPREEIEQKKHTDAQDEDCIEIDSVTVNPCVFVKGVDDLLNEGMDLKSLDRKVKVLSNEQEFLFSQPTDHGLYAHSEKAKELLQEISSLPFKTSKQRALEKKCNEIVKKYDEIKNKHKFSNDFFKNVHKSLQEISGIGSRIAESINVDGLSIVNDLSTKKDTELQPMKIVSKDKSEEIIVPERLHKDVGRTNYEFDGNLITVEMNGGKFLAAKNLQNELGEIGLWKLGPLINQSLFGDFSVSFGTGHEVNKQQVESTPGFGQFSDNLFEALKFLKFGYKDPIETEKEMLQKQVNERCFKKISFQKEKDGGLLITATLYGTFMSERTKPLFCKFSQKVKISKEEMEKINSLSSEALKTISTLKIRNPDLIDKIKDASIENLNQLQNEVGNISENELKEIKKILNPIKIESVELEDPKFVEGIDQLFELHDTEQKAQILEKLKESNLISQQSLENIKKLKLDQIEKIKDTPIEKLKELQNEVGNISEEELKEIKKILTPKDIESFVPAKPPLVSIQPSEPNNENEEQNSKIIEEKIDVNFLNQAIENKNLEKDPLAPSLSNLNLSDVGLKTSSENEVGPGDTLILGNDNNISLKKPTDKINDQVLEGSQNLLNLKEISNTTKKEDNIEEKFDKNKGKLPPIKEKKTFFGTIRSFFSRLAIRWSNWWSSWSIFKRKG